MLVRRRPTHVDQIRLHFVRGRLVSAVTCDFLNWCSVRLAAQGITGLFLVWDNAAWHKRQHVRAWIGVHHREVKRIGQGVRFIPCLLPSKSPWVHPIEPKWVHGKRAVAEPARLRSADELEQCVCDDYGWDRVPHVTMPEKVA